MVNGEGDVRRWSLVGRREMLGERGRREVRRGKEKEKEWCVCVCERERERERDRARRLEKKSTGGLTSHGPGNPPHSPRK